jgi:hypothetical protein
MVGEDHIRDATKMVSDTPRTDAKRGFHDLDTAVDAEFSEQLERELNAANERIRLLIAERDTARRQADQNYKLREEFRKLLGTDDVEQGVIVVREMKERIKRLEQLGDALAYAIEESCDPTFANDVTRWRKNREAME